MKQKMITMNLLFSILNFVIVLGINFFLSPYIVKHVGTAAYGFVTLANNFINYAAIATVAINSMAGRFITIAIHKEDHLNANKYFNSILMANIIISAILFFVTIVCVFQLDHLINVPLELLTDVKVLFLLIFSSFIITTIFTVFSTATFANNRLDLQYKKQAESNIIKVIILFVLFTLLSPNITYVGIATIISTIYIVGYQFYYTKKFFPNIKINKKYCDFKKIAEVFFAGIWNTITNIGNTLFDGLDVLLSNLFIGPLAMGKIAISKAITSVFGSLLATLSNVFNPQLVIDYAKEDRQTLVSDLKVSMKLSGCFANICLGILIAFGFSFYKLWIPGQDIHLIYIATILSCMGVIVSGVVTPMSYVYTITKKVKTNSFIVLATGIISVSMTFLLLKTTDLGLYAIAGTSTIINIIRNLTITPIYTAHCLDVSKKTFYPLILKYMLSTGCIVLIFSFIHKILNPTTWFILVIGCALSSLVGLTINYFIFLDSEERKLIKTTLLKWKKVS